ncbi:MAG: efflux RND transporter permease subunit [Gammaproteobacteria bacterium]|nr:efflux RND transporter permease subunit [Gammaproteobacteria bacterium]
MAPFFIERPVFAWVIAILIMLAGLLAIKTLPIQQYPTIAPPTVNINASYPGASAKTIENTVTQIIEQNMSGLDYLRYFSATSDSSGNVTVTLTFEPEADPDIAQVQVQNKLSQAMRLLPQEVQQQGVRVTKSSGSFLLVAAFYSENNQMSQYEISDYVASNLQDPISRINGVGQIQVFGPQNSMRIWMDPNKLISYKLTTIDLINAIKSQNNQIAAGQLGGAPAVPGQQLNATVIALTRLQTVEEFSDILIRVNPDGSRIFLKDVARVEMGAENYDLVARFVGKPASGIGVNLSSGANALATADAVKQKIKDLSPFFPQDLKVDYPFDTTPFVKVSIKDVIRTLFEAICLVFIVMYVFLQNFRATIIPTIAVPVVLLGTFGVLAAFGYSINTLTLFGMVLAIGLLVDDAIVVVENVERIMEEDNLSPKDATKKSMGQITGALIGIAMVLSAVFVPMAFFSGSAGAIYRQFSVTVVSSMVLSVLVALSLTPALCATLLKSTGNNKIRHDKYNKYSIFKQFNKGFERATHFYEKTVGIVLSRKIIFIIIYFILTAVMILFFLRIPTSFLPDEDQGRMFALISTPPNATTERTMKVVKQLENYLLTKEQDNVKNFFTVVGFSFAGRGQNAGMAFVNLKDWKVRTRSEQKVFAIAARTNANMAKIRDALIFMITPPAVQELGNAGGFDFQLLDRANLGHEKLMDARNQLLGMAAQNKNLIGVRPNGLEDTPQYKIDVDQVKASSLALSLNDIYSTLGSAWGSTYVNDFIDKGRVKKVYLQAEASSRMLPSDINKWYVRNANNEMVPFSNFATGHWELGSPRLERFNGISSSQIQGNAAPGVSSGQAMSEIEAMAAKLPPGFGFEWTGLSFEERHAGSQAPVLYAISLLIVFLSLAALYESWSIPFAVILVVPLGILGAVIATHFFGQLNNIYFQVGLLLTIGLSAKNAILIVEFAKKLHENGTNLISATLEAAHIRLRPIIMTSTALILGVLPLAISSGVGSGSQNAIGVGVVGGMISATILIIFFAPLFFVVIYQLSKNIKNTKKQETQR